MSFLNGLPFPDASDPAFGVGVNEVLRYEQNLIMGKVMNREINDEKPKSVYAHLLTGDNVYPQYHELLRGGSDAEYAPMSTESNDLSLMIPDKNNAANVQDVDAFFVIEAVIDVDSIDGINMAKAFLDLIHSAPEKWHDTENVSVGFRMVLEKEGIKGHPKGVGLAGLFCSASRVRPKILKRAIELIVENGSYLDGLRRIETAHDIDEESKKTLGDITKYVAKCSNKGTTDKTNYYTANGRVYSPVEGVFGPFITEDDVKMLINVDLDKTVGMTKLIAQKFVPKDGSTSSKEKTMSIHNAVTLAQTALNYAFSKSESSALSQFAQKASSGIVEVMESVATSEEGRNPLYFSWNEEFAKKKLQVSQICLPRCSSIITRTSYALLVNKQVEVSVILDPLTEPTQRVAPLLLAIRDYLKIPLKLLIAPRQIVENRLPLSSYYRFALDPTAIPDMNPPAALFSNLPSNHLLTVRLDVPETFDVQQSFAIQDADNLRCDAKYGCGDKAYILANGGEVLENLQPSNGVELTQIEYSLKSLLFFGQCYDATTSSPPNGLQLTLDRSTLPEQQSASEIQINPDGSFAEIAKNKVDISHTDTLVMKTAGYWQLRANPGVWDLKIAEDSRGAEIYHMVDGSLSPYGRLIIDKDAASFMSKSMVMKDFTDHRQLLVVKRNKGHEMSKLYLDESDLEAVSNNGNETVHVFSLATGHAYERLLKIMMLSVTKRTKSPVKFWFFENVSRTQYLHDIRLDAVSS
jgi:hypothetical protein